MKILRARKWLMLAALVSGTTFQLTACRDQAGLFGERVLFSSFFLPINNQIVLVYQVVASTIQQFIAGIFVPTV